MLQWSVDLTRLFSERPHADNNQATSLLASRQYGLEMLQKGQVQSVFVPRRSTPVPSDVTETYDTEFEEDVSDFEEYSGRRSEESVCVTGKDLRVAR